MAADRERKPSLRNSVCAFPLVPLICVRPIRGVVGI
jgi:hypothetical protein